MLNSAYSYIFNCVHLQVKQLHEKGKALSKSGHLSEAMQIYQKAITICTTYDFRALAADVYYSAAQLHQEWGQFQLAFQLGTVSIEMKPSAKVHVRTYHCLIHVTTVDTIKSFHYHTIVRVVYYCGYLLYFEHSIVTVKVTALCSSAYSRTLIIRTNWEFM